MQNLVANELYTSVSHFYINNLRCWTSKGWPTTRQVFLNFFWHFDTFTVCSSNVKCLINHRIKCFCLIIKISFNASMKYLANILRPSLLKSNKNWARHIDFIFSWNFAFVSVVNFEINKQKIIHASEFLRITLNILLKIFWLQLKAFEAYYT